MFHPQITGSSIEKHLPQWMQGEMRRLKKLP